MNIDENDQSLILPGGKMTEAWGKRVALSINSMVNSSSVDRIRDWTCHNYYHGIRRNSDFHYLTKTYGVEYPAKLRHIPLVRPNIDRLWGEQVSLRNVFQVYCIDQDSVEAKMTDVAERIAQRVLVKKIKDISRKAKIAKQKQAEQMQQQAPVDQSGLDGVQATSPEQQMQPGPVNYNQPESYELPEEEDEFTSFLTEEDKKFIAEGARKVMTHYEISQNKILRNEMEEQEVHRKWSMMFKEYLIYGKCFYKLQSRANGTYEFKPVSTLSISYPGMDTNRWLKEAPWVVEEMFLTPYEVMDYLRHRMKPEELAKIKEQATANNLSSLAGPNQQNQQFLFDITFNRQSSVNPDDGRIYSGSVGNSNGKMRVRRICFKAIEEIKVKYGKDKNNRFHFHRVDKFDNRKNYEYEERYKEWIYDTYIIGDEEIMLTPELLENQFRKASDPYKANMPYNGEIYNSHMGTAMSLVWETRHLQDLYDIVHFHKEMMIAISGSKGVLYDLSQKPKDYTFKEIMYYRKLGWMLINSQDGTSSGDKKNNGFNQWQNFDDTLSQSITVLIKIAEHLETVCGRITGVPYTRMGERKPYDGLGVNENSLSESAVVTRALFQGFHDLKRKALEDIITYCSQNTAQKKYLMNYLSEYEYEAIRIINVENGESNRDKAVYLSDGYEEQRDKQEMKQIAYNLLKDQQIQLPDLIGLFRGKSMAEIEVKMKEAYELRRKELQESETQKHQQLMQIEKAKQQQLEATELARLKVDEAKIQNDINKLALEKEKIENDLFVKMMEGKLKEFEIVSENERSQVQVDRDEILGRINLEAADKKNLYEEKKAALDLKKKEVDLAIAQEKQAVPEV